MLRRLFSKVGTAWERRSKSLITQLRNSSPAIREMSGFSQRLSAPILTIRGKLRHNTLLDSPAISSDLNDFSTPVSHSSFVKVSFNKIGTYGSSTGDMHIADSLIGISVAECD
ncbi:hypothetical protein TNCV_4311691 [Trichonephila clavipes]|nr:hypothetical protein TNCV_4311691 [Trichonephila clavipes]